MKPVRKRRLLRIIVALAVCALLVAETATAARLMRKKRCACVCKTPCIETCENTACEAAADCESGAPVEPTEAVEVAGDEAAPEGDPLPTEPPAAEPVPESDPLHVAAPPMETPPYSAGEVLAAEPDVADPRPQPDEERPEPLPSEATPDPAAAEPEPLEEAEPSADEFDDLFSDESAEADPPADDTPLFDTPAEVMEEPTAEPAEADPLFDEESLFDAPDEEPAAVTEEPTPEAAEPEEDSTWEDDFFSTEPSEEPPAAEEQTPADMPTDSAPAETFPADESTDDAFVDPLFAEPEPAADQPAEPPATAEPTETEPATETDPLEGLFGIPAAEEAPPADDEQPQEEYREPSMEELFSPPRSSTPAVPSRQWVDRTGQHSLSASLLRATTSSVLLVDGDGQNWAIEYSRMSDEDLAFVKSEITVMQAQHRLQAVPAAQPVSDRTQQR